MQLLIDSYLIPASDIKVTQVNFTLREFRVVREFRNEMLLSEV